VCNELLHKVGYVQENESHCYLLHNQLLRNQIVMDE
jgi:hypothetical protein